ncbi:hypothetical protein HZ326_29714, partial [Fusarium oxysporum f. sp. albedinis]
MLTPSPAVGRVLAVRWSAGAPR